MYTSELQLKVNCRPKVNCRIKIGLAWPTVATAPMFSYNSLSAAIHLYMIQPQMCENYVCKYVLPTYIKKMLFCFQLLKN